MDKSNKNHKQTRREKTIMSFEKEFFKDKEYIEVDYIIGADMFVRGELARKIKFDNDYFMYFEEADFQLKVRKMGFKIGIIKGGRIIHLESKSFKISNAKRTMKMVSLCKIPKEKLSFNLHNI